MSGNQASLIINSPYTEPSHHWEFTQEGEPHKLVKGRRQAGYMVADPRAKPHQDKGTFIPLRLANKIRERVDNWRGEGWPGITGDTKKLLEHWTDKEQREFPFFFCQIEAIETLIWLIEAPESEKTGVVIPSDGGEFRRICSKLATGTGKTIVMAMLIAWQTINRVAHPRDGRFSRDFFVVAPNLTVKERLSVLVPSHGQNYYDEFNVVPTALREQLLQARVQVRNWHVLNWETEEKIKKKRSVDKRGAKSDEAYIREVLGDMASARNLVVINDEAHHAWRVPGELNLKGIEKEEIEEATKWVGGLDRIHKTRGILNCFDFSATPYIPTGKGTSEESLFGWIVSDFGLNEAIESGLVKTPRVVVRDDALPDAKTHKSRLYHIYSDKEVVEDLKGKADPGASLPDLVVNAYALLGLDWEKTREAWGGRETPPVMITVANRTETAARIKYAFDNKRINIEALCDPEGILHIDSKVLKEAEAKESTSQTVNSSAEPKQKLTKKDQADMLREKVNTVGQVGQPGARIQNVISVGMLSEGWDARTVTHIMGLRPFTSQLLCEQVVGRGLRRASYEINEQTERFDAEYVNVFGVPFSFLAHETSTNGPPPPPDLKITIRPVDEKKEYAIRWPNVVRIDRTYTPRLSVDWSKIAPLKIDTSKTVQLAEIAPTVNGKPDFSKITEMDLEQLTKETRKQTVIFEAAREAWNKQKPAWKGSEALLMAELVRLAEEFLNSDRIAISPALFNQDPKKRQIVIVLNMSKIFRHFWQAIEFGNTEKAAPVLDGNRPIYSTGDMRPWRTGKPCKPAKKSHINYCVYDSTWEASEAFELDRNKAVDAWVKNDHLGFEVLYVHGGVVRKYYPDFLIRLKSGAMLVLETKGQQTDQDTDKHAAMKEWTKAVSDHGGFGQWKFAVSTKPSDIKDILAR